MNYKTKNVLWVCAALVNITVLLLAASSAKAEIPGPIPDASGSLGTQQIVIEEMEIGNADRDLLYSPATGVENFEGGFPDAYWSVGDLDGGNGSDYWDDVTCNDFSGDRSAWCAGTGNQTDCDLYDDNMESFMCVEAEYEGSSHNNTDRFYFSFWNEVEDCCDYMWVSIGGFRHEPRHGIGVCTPHVVASQAFKSSSGCGGDCTCYHGRCWARVRVRLGSGFNGTPFLRICFRFHADENTRREGAYFDDIRFNGQSDTKIFPLLNGFNGNSCKSTSVCGGIAGTQCDDGYECYYGPNPNFPCGTSDRTGTCRQYGVLCPGTDLPVCGCNGVTYRNECFATRANAEVAHNGPCCTSNSDCDSGEYCEKDDADCTGGGECTSRPTSCPGTIDHVCGCNGQTYDNPCKAAQAGVNVARSGACDSSCPGGPFTIGGAIYSDCAQPITTGIPDVNVEVTCGASKYQTTTSGGQGLWQIPDLPCGTCTVCPEKPGHTFAHVGPGCQEEGMCHTIVVSQANQGANQSIQFLGMTEDCTPFDLNDDGFASIIGDVPLAVDCIYRNDCRCPEPGCICPADCNCDGFLTIIGDVPCLVDCYYRQLCQDRCAGSTAAATAPIGDAPASSVAAGGFTIGGAIYTSLNDPLGTGLTAVTVTLACTGRPNATAMTSGGQGLWSFVNVAGGSCTVTPDRSGYCFELIDNGILRGQGSFAFTVDAAHQQQNQSIQFLAGTECSSALGGCCLAGGSCGMALQENCAGRFLGTGLTCSGDPDDDDVAGCTDMCPERSAPGGVDSTGRPLGDLTGDCSVRLDDFAIFQNNFAGP